MIITTLATLLLSAPPAAEPPTRPAPTHQLFGMLTEEGDMFCTGDASPQWINPRFEVGFVRVVTSAVDLEALAGGPVVVTGRPATVPASKPIEHTGQCPIPQMRSDWVWSKSGMRMRRAESPLAGFAVAKARRLTELTAEQNNDEVTIRFKRPLRVKGPITLTLHYEGCGGKPGSRSKSKKFARGKAISFSAPAILRGDGRHNSYRAYSVEVRADGTRVHFDLDVRLHHLGVTTRCGKRGGKGR